MSTGDFQVPVPAAKLVQKAFFLLRILQPDMVIQVEQAAHIGGLHGTQGVLYGILLKKVVEKVAVVHILRDRDLQTSVPVSLAAGHDAAEEADAADHSRSQDRQTDAAHSAGQAHRHGQENDGDILRRARRGAKADETEGAHHRYAGAHGAVDQHNDHLDQEGKKDQRAEQAVAAVVRLSADKGDDGAQNQGNRRGGQKHGC